MRQDTLISLGALIGASFLALNILIAISGPPIIGRYYGQVVEAKKTGAWVNLLVGGTSNQSQAQCEQDFFLSNQTEPLRGISWPNGSFVYIVEHSDWPHGTYYTVDGFSSLATELAVRYGSQCLK